MHLLPAEQLQVDALPHALPVARFQRLGVQLGLVVHLAFDHLTTPARATPPGCIHGGSRSLLQINSEQGLKRGFSWFQIDIIIKSIAK